MKSKIFVRTVLVTIILSLLGTIFVTLASDRFDNIGQKLVSLIVESGVLLAALSLLIESFRSFGKITIKKNSLWEFLSGVSFLESYKDDVKKEVVTARTCELFAFRSVAIAFSSLLTLALVFTLYRFVIFLLSPHPIVIGSEIFQIVISTIVTCICAVGLMAGGSYLENKISGKSFVIKVICLGLYYSISVGVLFGFFFLFTAPDLVAGVPIYLVILQSIGATLTIATGVGIVFSIGLGLYKLVLMISQKFPALSSVWNQICPVQEIHFVD